MSDIKLKRIKEEKEFTVYSQHIMEKDEQTGEVLRDTTVDVIKAKKRDNFIKIFVTNLDFLGANLNNAERQVLVGFLAKVDYQNVVYIHPQLRRELEKKYSISQATITAGIKGLKQKKVLLEITPNLQDKLEVYANNAFLINPDIAGKGSFNEIKKLRQEVLLEYDFDSLEIKRSYYTKTEYDGLQEIKNNLDSHEIKEIIHNKDDVKDNVKVVVSDKEFVDDEFIEDIEAEACQEAVITDFTNVSEAEILKLKAQADLAEKEKINAEREKIEAENERLRLKIELAKISKTKAEPSLFDMPSSDDKDF